MMPMFLRRALRGVTAGLLLVAAAPAAAQSGADDAAVAAIAHRAELVFDIEAHTVRVSDYLRIPAGVAELRLGDALAVESIVITDNMKLDPRVAVTLEEDEDGPYQALDLAAMGMGQGGQMMIVYAGTFHQPVDDVVFSREKVGGEISATIGEEGFHLLKAPVKRVAGLDTPHAFAPVLEDYILPRKEDLISAVWDVIDY